MGPRLSTGPRNGLVSVALGTLEKGALHVAPLGYWRPLYGDATSAKPHLSELTGSPPCSGVSNGKTQLARAR